MPFTDRTMSFLVENRIMDSREWFHAHRDEYEKNIVEPMAELCVAVMPTALEIDPEFIAIPKVGKSISRLWRDTRFTKDGSIFRDYVWCSFLREKYRGMPELWFSVSPQGVEWGCGWYWTSSETMANIRKSVIEDDPEWLAADAALRSSPELALVGNRYKKSPYTAYSDEKRVWLDQRNISVQSPVYAELMFSDALADGIISSFRTMAPMYRFFLHNTVRMTWGSEREK